MKTVKRYAFPVLLILSCGTVWFWQHAMVSLPYLPLNEVVPLAVMTPLLLVFTFFVSFALLKTCGTPRPVLRSLLSTSAMLALVLAAGVFFLSFLTYRFAAPLPVLQLPDWPVGVVMCIVAVLCVSHLTGLLLYGLIKKKTPVRRFVPALLGWFLLNCCLALLTV